MKESDRLKALERKRRWRKRKHEERYGPGAGSMAGKHGNHATGDAHARWRGGKRETVWGYIQVRVGPGHYRPEHDLVMEEHLGRRLRPNEVVHHGPGGKKDNRLENLTLEIRSDHSRHHALDRVRDENGRFKA